MGAIKQFFSKLFGRGASVDDSSMVTAGTPYVGRGYTTGYGSGGAKWPYGLSASGSGMLLDHWTLRQNARDAYHDTPQARAIIERFADTVVGPGLRLESTPKFDVLGIDAEAAEEWARDVEERFDLWARSKDSTRDGILTFYQSQRQVEIFRQRDGEGFVRLFYNGDRSLLSPLQLGFVDPTQVRGDAFTSTYGPVEAYDGIERDDAGREVGYKIWISKGSTYREVTIPAWGPGKRRRFMLHFYQPEYAGQGRGYSRLSHALQEFENLTDFTSAQIKKAINQSQVAMFVKPSKDAPASSPFETAINRYQGAGPTAEVAYTPGNVPSAMSTEVTYHEMPEATAARPGSWAVVNLEGGESLEPLKHTAPSDTFEEFSNAFLSYVSASMSMPIEVLLMKFGQNYSASRGTLLLFWLVAQIEREDIDADYNNPIYEMWLSEEIARGRIQAPGWQDPRLRRAWLSANWIGPQMPNIDPMRTAESDKIYTELGAQTLDRVARNHNGSNGKMNRAKLAREFSELPPVPWGKSSGGGDNG